MERRHFLAGLPAAAALNAIVAKESEASSKTPEPFLRMARVLHAIQDPVWKAWKENRLVSTLDRPEFPRADRRRYLALEAVARNFYCLCQSDPDGKFLTPEIMAVLSRSLEPGHPDSFNWDQGDQPLVDSAILAAGFLQNPVLFENKLSPGIREGLLSGWRKSLAIKPYDSNWLLFAAMAEAALQKWDKAFKPEAIPFALKKFEDWYAGDGWYNDGSRFHLDYYNSIIIQPFLLILGKLGHVDSSLKEKHRIRAQRHAVQLERMVMEDGNFPALGRSLCYRAGLFHHLAFLAKEELLPDSLPPSRIRTLLARLVEKTLQPGKNGVPGDQVQDPKTGILKPGLFGYQPQLAETYINSASLYLTTWAFLPLGLGQNHPFWQDSPKTGALPIDKALKD